VTSQGYPAGKRAFPACARDLSSQPRFTPAWPAAALAGTDAGLPPAPEPLGTPCAGADGESPAGRRSGGNAAALKCDGAAGPEKQDKREESGYG